MDEATRMTKPAVAAEAPGDRLARIIAERGYLSPQHFAEVRGFKWNTVYSHIKGLRGIKPAMADRYAVALGCTSAWLLFATEAGRIEYWLSPRFGGDTIDIPADLGTANLPPTIADLGNVVLACCNDAIGPFFPRGTILAIRRLTDGPPPASAPLLVREHHAESLSRTLPWFPATTGRSRETKYINPTQPGRLTFLDVRAGKEILGYVVGFWYSGPKAPVTS